MPGILDGGTFPGTEAPDLAPATETADSKQEESAVLVMTDIHYGRKTSSYNPSVCLERLDRVGAHLARVRQLLAEYYITELVIALIGDVNDGTDIYATQPHHQAITNVEHQARELSTYLAHWLEKQSQVWPSIRVEAVPGNHGRAGRFAHEAANWDIVAYRYLEYQARALNIPVNIGEGDDLFLRKVLIRGHNYLFYHGHDIRTFSNIPWYGMMLRLSRWLSTSLAPFDVVCMGHFHTLGYWLINRIHLFESGTMITDDEWALRTFGWESASRWWLFGVSNSRPVTWQFTIDLT